MVCFTKDCARNARELRIRESVETTRLYDSSAVLCGTVPSCETMVIWEQSDHCTTDGETLTCWHGMSCIVALSFCNMLLPWGRTVPTRGIFFYHLNTDVRYSLKDDWWMIRISFKRLLIKSILLQLFPSIQEILQWKKTLY